MPKFRSSESLPAPKARTLRLPPAGTADISEITPQLYLAARPRSAHVPAVHALAIDLVISMIWFRPTAELTRPPFRLVRLPSIDSPFTPIPLFLLRRGVSAALPVLEAGGRVLVYCRAGRHRSVAMMCCILVAQGMTSAEAMELVKARRPRADPHAFYIASRIRAFERDWMRRQHLETTDDRRIEP
jgi:protein-tyrosine phosphatase